MKRLRMAESTGFEPVTLAGGLLSKQLPRPAGRSPNGAGQRIRTSKTTGLSRRCLPVASGPLMVGEVGFEPTKSPRSERGAVASLTTRPIGPAPRIRTGNIQALDLTPLPVGLEPDGAGRRIRTCTERGLKPLLLPIERVQLVMAEGEGFEPSCRLRRRFSGPGRCQFRYNPPHSRINCVSAKLVVTGIGTSV